MLVSLLAALAEPTRLETIRLLWSEGELCACQLLPRLGATQSRVSRHMQVLKQAGLVIDRRDAQRVFYAINPALPAKSRTVLEAVMMASGVTRLAA